MDLTQLIKDDLEQTQTIAEDAQNTANQANTDVSTLTSNVNYYKQSIQVPLVDNDENETVLTDTQNRYIRLVLTGTLTKEQELVVSDDERFLEVKNETGFAIKVKTASGTGVHIAVDESYSIRVVDGNVETNGSNNKLVILPPATRGNSTGYTFPHGLTSSDFSELKLHSGISGDTPSVSRGVGELSKWQIMEDEDGWELGAYHSTATTTRLSTVIATSTTGFDIAVTDANATLLTGKLDDGVTY